MKRLLLSALALASFLGLFGLALLPVGLSLATDVAIVVTIGILLLGAVPGRTSRLFFVTLCAWVVVRYISWRFTSLPLEGELPSRIAAIVLLLAECYGVAMLLLGLFANAWVMERKPAPLPKDPKDYPTVDIYIPTYSEPVSIVASTLMAAVEIDYPRDKFKVYVLDDGHPRSLNPKTPKTQAKELAERSRALRELCEKHGATWLTREKNEHAKSGNMNSAMQQTDGALLLILDADHIPTRDILKNTVGFFVDERMAFVQTPHFFVNADPLERNLNLANRMPAENDMFYRVVQKGLDLWNTSFFCGSAAIIRRTAIEDVGGFSTVSITEDASTSIKMHQRGWRSAYLGIPMVAGLQPETFASFTVQRLRWGMGMTQILVKQNPLLVRGLKPAQRLCYLSVSLFWLFPFARVVFFIAPLLSLFFNMEVYPVGAELFLAYTVPYLVAGVMSFQRMFGKVRRILISEVYETLQAFYALPALIATLLAPSKPTFKVTPKGERLDKEFISELNAPFYAFLLITVVGLLWGVGRMWLEPQARSALALSVSWLFLNLVLLMGAMGVLLEKPQRRLRQRIKMNETALLTGPFGQRQAEILDMHETALRLRLPNGEVLENFEITLDDVTYPTEPIKSRAPTLPPGELVVRLGFPTAEHERKALMFAYGSSDRWMQMWTAREASTNILFSALGVMRINLSAGMAHIKRLVND